MPGTRAPDRRLGPRRRSCLWQVHCVVRKPVGHQPDGGPEGRGQPDSGQQGSIDPAHEVIHLSGHPGAHLWTRPPASILECSPQPCHGQGGRDACATDSGCATRGRKQRLHWAAGCAGTRGSPGNTEHRASLRPSSRRTNSPTTRHGAVPTHGSTAVTVQVPEPTEAVATWSQSPHSARRPQLCHHGYGDAASTNEPF